MKGNRVVQVIITCLIVVGFWNLLDYILDEYVTHEGYVFSVYYDVLLPIIVGLAVELFPKKKDKPAGKQAGSRGSGKKAKRR